VEGEWCIQLAKGGQRISTKRKDDTKKPGGGGKPVRFESKPEGKEKSALIRDEGKKN